LLGFVSLVIEPLGLRIRDCTFHRKDGSSWISFPARPYVAKDGKQTWAAILEITTTEGRARFQRAAVPAVEAFIAKHGDADHV
jgi:hypothetical protein